MALSLSRTILPLRRWVTSRSTRKSPARPTRLSLERLEQRQLLSISQPLAWSTYLGGTEGNEGVSAIATDSQGNIVVTGETYSTGLGAGTGFDSSYGGAGDAFVAKISPSGTLLWASYLGGSDWDYGNAITVDSQDNILVAGTTYSPASSEWISGGTLGGESDAFVVKLSSTGTLVWSKYVGGSTPGVTGAEAWEEGFGIAVDSQRNVIVTGSTGSSGWVTGGHDTGYSDDSYGMGDGFVVKLNSSGTHLWSTYFGGTDLEDINAVGVDSLDNIVVAGTTWSANSTNWIAGGFDTTANGLLPYDAFVAKFSSSGVHSWSTYLGGSQEDEGYAIAVDSANNILVGGSTWSDDWASISWASNGYDTTQGGGEDGFAAKLSSSGQPLWHTYLGGSGDEQAYAIARDSGNNVVVAGSTGSAGWVSGGYDTTLDGQDGFVAKLNSSGVHLRSTYLGGSSPEDGYGIAVDSSNGVVVAGATGSASWTSGGFDTGYNGGNSDGFVAKFRAPEPDKIGIFRANGASGQFIMDSNKSGAWDALDRGVLYGNAGDIPISGDWDGDGRTEIGVFRANGSLGQFILDSNNSGTVDAQDRIITYGYGGDTPVIGDWDGNGRDQVGVFRAIGFLGQFILDFNDNGTFDASDRVLMYGYAGDTPVVGDWNGDGRDQVGNFRKIGNLGQFILDSNDSGAFDASDRVAMYGFAGDTPIIGDWNGDGRDQIGNFRKIGDMAQFILDSDDSGAWEAQDRVILNGFSGDIPLIGDWNDDGRDQVGNYRAFGGQGQFILDSNDSGTWNPEDRAVLYGNAGDKPVIGDWDGNGYDQVGNFRPMGPSSQFILDSNDSGAWESPDRTALYGFSGDIPVIGDWNGDGRDQIGVFRAIGDLGQFILDTNDSGAFESGDRFFYYGYAGDRPVVGDWDGDGRDQVGAFRTIGYLGQFILDTNDSGAFESSDRIFYYGFAGDTPIVGDWDGDERDQAGNFRKIGDMGQFILDSNDSGEWEAADYVTMYGYCGDTPIIGRWAPPSPLLAAGGERSVSADLAALQASDLEPIVAEALRSWASLGIDSQLAASLAGVQYVITDLPGATLGLAEHSTIYLDYNAAGYGWFVDPTPSLDEEFQRSDSRATLTASAASAADRMDLLTVVSHELGHVLGLEDLDALADGLMSSTLQRGTRRAAGVAELDALFAGYERGL